MWKPQHRCAAPRMLNGEERLKQGRDLVDHLVGVGIEIEYQGGFQVVQLFALLAMLFAAAGDVQHHDLFGINFAGLDSVDQRGKCNTRGRVDIDPFGLFEQFFRCTGLFVGCSQNISIGIDQGRLNGLSIDIALFTNFTRDHLDYHHDMAAYKAAKRRLFDWPGLRHAVVNLDDPMGMELVDALKGKVALTGYSRVSGISTDVPLIRAADIRNRVQGTEFRVESPMGTARVKTQLIGLFNVSNVLGVLGVLLAADIPWDTAVRALGKLLPPPGRMQQMGGKERPLVVIDFAHTPDAMAKGLETLRQVADERHGKLWCVFGCGGDRDHGKRPQMGRVSELADFVIVTSDNPRNEAPGQIIEEIVAGMKARPQIYEDRATAILQAVRQAAKNDVIFLAGKGHEAYQEIRGVKLPFADADHVALALASRIQNMKVAV